MSALFKRRPTAVLCVVVVGLMTIALAAPAGAMSAEPPGAPAHALGTDVASPDQQAPRPVVNALGTDVAAPDQQAPIAATEEDSTPSIALFGLIALALGGIAFAVARLAASRSRTRVAV